MGDPDPTCPFPRPPTSRRRQPPATSVFCRLPFVSTVFKNLPFLNLKTPKTVYQPFIKKSSLHMPSTACCQSDIFQLLCPAHLVLPTALSTGSSRRTRGSCCSREGAAAPERELLQLLLRREQSSCCSAGAGGPELAAPAAATAVRRSSWRTRGSCCSQVLVDQLLRQGPAAPHKKMGFFSRLSRGCGVKHIAMCSRNTR